ncbi:ATP-binding protein [Actinomadura welshii]
MQSTPADLTAQTGRPDEQADPMNGAHAMNGTTQKARGPSGTMPGWVWALPGGPGCAGHARAVLRDALASLGVPRDVIADAQLMVSELVTNAHQHAGEHGPHELWLYTAGTEPGERAGRMHGSDVSVSGGGMHGAGMQGGEVWCAVFDTLADAVLPGYSWTSGDCGRGLSIVQELSGGRWGTRRTLSRLGPSVRGKAVWFTVPGAAPSLA